MKQAIQQWLLMLNAREKVMVFGGLGVAVLILLWAMVLEPLKTKHIKLETQIQERENELRWMQMAQGSIQQAQNNPVSSRPKTPTNPSQVIEVVLKKYQLKKGLKQMRGSDEVRISLKEVNVDHVMQFLGELETKYSLHLLKMDIAPLNDKGTVNASLRLGK